MLPQMMPLPWLLIFILSFLTYFSVSLFFNNFMGSSTVINKSVKSSFSKLPW